jgi:NADH-ubiquinone oxidoreductase chain 5
VTAGIFLVIRISFIFEYAPEVLVVVTVIGALTAIFAASTALVQNDVKKIIAYSTCSQLGYIAFTCGLSNYVISLFHLVNHAFFKALLFLTAGVIIHRFSDEQDIRKIGGLQAVIPLNYILIAIGNLALLGFPFLTRFYSKDLILELTYLHISVSANFAYYIRVLTAVLTSIYSTRLIYFSFIGKPNGYKANFEHIHFNSGLISVPLFILAICSIIAGYLGHEIFIFSALSFFNTSIFVLPVDTTILNIEFLPV